MKFMKAAVFSLEEPSRKSGHMLQKKMAGRGEFVDYFTSY